MKAARSRGAARVIALSIVASAIGSCSGSGSKGVQEETLPSSYPGAKIIFVTSSAGHGNLLGWMSQCSGRSTGLEAADCICQEHARLWGSLSGTYKAWLSDSTQNAAARLSHPSVPYVNRRGVVIAGSWAELTNALCMEAMNYNEAGDTTYTHGSILVWTGSDSSGNALTPAKTCDDWTGGGAWLGGWVGSAGVDAYWPNFAGCWSEWVDGGGWRDCDDHNSLYCIEQ